MEFAEVIQDYKETYVARLTPWVRSEYVDIEALEWTNRNGDIAHRRFHYVVWRFCGFANFTISRIVSNVLYHSRPI